LRGTNVDESPRREARMGGAEGNWKGRKDHRCSGCEAEQWSEVSDLVEGRVEDGVSRRWEGICLIEFMIKGKCLVGERVM
jgi:hypothetical protein